MAIHSIEPVRAHLHGHFSRELQPVLEIDSGDSVAFRTLDAGWGAYEQDAEGAFRKFEPRHPELDVGHALCGPVAIRGARPGMVLEVIVHTVRPARWGWSSAGGFASPGNVRFRVAEPPERMLRWRLNPDAGTAVEESGRTIPIRPFLGVIGMPPAEPGRHSTIPPRATGGNLDCKELIAGSRLFLPITVEGGLVSVGDGHAVQGDGEVAGPALECPMERAELQFQLHDSHSLLMPRANAPIGWITFGLHESLDEAWAIALEGMLDLMATEFHLERKEALSLCSLLVDLRVTQVVNGVRGVHAILPHGLLRSTAPVLG
jgi:acetamidase/formamidase